MFRFSTIFNPLLFLAMAASVYSQFASADNRLHATGGATQLEGAAGGGLSPWAVILGYGTSDESDFVFSQSYVESDDYTLNSNGLGLGINNRWEFSFNRQRFNLGTLADITGLPSVIEQDIWGVKARITGDLIYTAHPQISVGLQYKRNRDFFVPSAVGAQRDSDFDYYVSASKLWLGSVFGRNVLANVTLRSTRANQMGILGFGGDANDAREIQVETSAAIMLNRYIAIGMEYRQKPNNLNFAEEEDWKDVFVAWFPNKNISIVGALTDLGSIGGLQGQHGSYISLQANF